MEEFLMHYTYLSDLIGYLIGVMHEGNKGKRDYYSNHFLTKEEMDEKVDFIVTGSTSFKNLVKEKYIYNHDSVDVLKTVESLIAMREIIFYGILHKLNETEV